jgi:hypothetical protein
MRSAGIVRRICLLVHRDGRLSQWPQRSSCSPPADCYRASGRSSPLAAHRAFSPLATG